MHGRLVRVISERLVQRQSAVVQIALFDKHFCFALVFDLDALLVERSEEEPLARKDKVTEEMPSSVDNLEGQPGRDNTRAYKLNHGLNEEC